MNETPSLRSELEQQVALAYALRGTAAASESFDPETLLKHILANIGWVIPHDAATVMLIEDGRAYVVCESGYSERGLGDWIRALRFPVTELAGFRYMIESGHPLCIADTHTDPLWAQYADVVWQNSYVAAPIRIKDQTIGFLNLDSATMGFFTALQADALAAFADQAALVIYNLQLLQETQRRLAAQTALLNASSVISSTLDLPTILQRCAEQLCRAANTTSAYICYWNREADTARVVADYYSPQASTHERAADPGKGEINTAYEAAWLSRQDMVEQHITDSNLPASLRQHMEHFGIQSRLSIPLTARSQTFGYAVLWETRHRREFTSEDIQLCLGIAQQTATAFDNARLLDAARQQLSLSRVLQAVGALLTAEMSLDEVFERLFNLLAEVIHYDCVSIELFDETDCVYLAAQRGFPDPALAHEVTRHVTGPNLRERWGNSSVIVIPDTQRDPRWLPLPEFDYIRARIIVWLRVKNRTFGILNVDSKTAHLYDSTSGETVAAFANQAAVAIENAQLSEAIRQHAAQLEQRVTERTTELAQEQQRRQAILDAAGDGIVFTDVRGMIEYINPAMEHLTGYTAAAALGQTARLWKSGLTPPAVYDELWQTVRRGEVWKGEMINRHKSGQLYDTALTVAPLRGPDTTINGYVGIQRDISQQKELDRLKDQFVSSVSHEFRAPLSNMKLYLSLLESGRPEKRDQYLQTLQRETVRLENLIEDLLYISRLDMGATTTRRAPTELHPLIAQMITDRADLAARHGLSLDYLPKLDLPPALAEATMFTQVISNLMANAINYTPGGGVVTLSTGMRLDNRQEWITISVQDTGPGISDADRPHIFERFYRGEAGRKSGAPGTGLGLSICRQVVEKMEGRLTVESTPGQGAMFTVWLKPVGTGDAGCVKRA
jgi:PAS domain S-box-containing protein